MKVFVSAVLASPLALISSPAPAQDATVELALTSQGIAYEIDKEGDYRVVYNYDDKRSQLVLVCTHTEEVGGLKVREVFSYVAHPRKSLSQAALIDLLRENATMKVGAYRLSEDDSGDFVIFAIHLPTDASPEQLKTAIEVVSETADEKEKVLTSGKDEF